MIGILLVSVVNISHSASWVFLILSHILRFHRQQLTKIWEVMAHKQVDLCSSQGKHYKSAILPWHHNMNSCSGYGHVHSLGFGVGLQSLIWHWVSYSYSHWWIHRSARTARNSGMLIFGQSPQGKVAGIGLNSRLAVTNENYSFMLIHSLFPRSLLGLTGVFE